LLYRLIIGINDSNEFKDKHLEFLGMCLEDKCELKDIHIDFTDCINITNKGFQKFLGSFYKNS